MPPSAAIPLVPFGRDPATVVPVVGENGFRALLPLVEPTSAGPLPVSPSRVTAWEHGYEVSRVPLACGLVKTAPAATSHRLRFRVDFVGLTFAQLRQLESFLEGLDVPSAGTDGVRGVGGRQDSSIVSGGAESGVLAFTVYPDEADGSPIKCIAVSSLESEAVTAMSRGHPHLVWNTSIDVEEVG